MIFLKVDQKRGFSLIEVMVALGILAISLVVLLGLRNRDVELSSYSGALFEATLLAKQKMTDQDLGGFPDLGSFQGDFGEKKSRYGWRKIVSPTPFDSVREVLITVFWERGDWEEEVKLTSYFFKQE